MTSDQLPAEIVPANRLLTAAEFHLLADVPPEVEWFANLSNAHTRRVYENAIRAQLNGRADFSQKFEHFRNSPLFWADCPLIAVPRGISGIDSVAKIGCLSGFCGDRISQRASP